MNAANIKAIAFLYFAILKLDPQNAKKHDRDRFILSKGHGAPALFQILGMKGFYPVSDLEHFGEDGGVFAEHPPTPDYLPGIEAATGSLGHGMPMGLGMAMASKILDQPYNVYALLGDGECNEGSVWEASMSAAHFKLDNLIAIVDYNKLQSDGNSETVMDIGLLEKKWESFGWDVISLDGHDIVALNDALSHSANNMKPKVIIAHTTKGKGVSFMENNNTWHHNRLTQTTFDQAIAELNL